MVHLYKILFSLAASIWVASNVNIYAASGLSSIPRQSNKLLNNPQAKNFARNQARSFSSQPNPWVEYFKKHAEDLQTATKDLKLYKRSGEKALSETINDNAYGLVNILTDQPLRRKGLMEHLNKALKHPGFSYFNNNTPAKTKLENFLKEYKAYWNQNSHKGTYKRLPDETVNITRARAAKNKQWLFDKRLSEEIIRNNRLNNANYFRKTDGLVNPESKITRLVKDSEFGVSSFFAKLEYETHGLEPIIEEALSHIAKLKQTPEIIRYKNKIETFLREYKKLWWHHPEPSYTNTENSLAHAYAKSIKPSANSREKLLEEIKLDRQKHQINQWNYWKEVYPFEAKRAREAKIQYIKDRFYLIADKVKNLFKK